mgnify:CR=1 FL=1
MLFKLLVVEVEVHITVILPLFHGTVLVWADRHSLELHEVFRESSCFVAKEVLDLCDLLVQVERVSFELVDYA